MLLLFDKKEEILDISGNIGAVGRHYLLTMKRSQSTSQSIK